MLIAVGNKVLDTGEIHHSYHVISGCAVPPNGSENFYWIVFKDGKEIMLTEKENNDLLSALKNEECNG